MFQISPKQNKFSPSFISLLFPSKWRINTLPSHAGPCGSEGKGDFLLWPGEGCRGYIQIASMTNISCIPEHSLFRSHTQRQSLTEANLKTMTCVILKPTQITATEGGRKGYPSVLFSLFPSKQTFNLFCWDIFISALYYKLSLAFIKSM